MKSKVKCSCGFQDVLSDFKPCSNKVKKYFPKTSRMRPDSKFFCTSCPKCNEPIWLVQYKD